MGSTPPVRLDLGIVSAKTSRSVLVVDDSDDVRAVLRTVLESDSVPVVEARNGVEGLDRLKSHSDIGLVFLDMNMPGMDGIEILRSIRSNPEFTTLPVVVLSGGSATGVVAARGLGAVGCLQKPVRCDVVLKLAKTFLARA